MCRVILLLSRCSRLTWRRLLKIINSNFIYSWCWAREFTDWIVCKSFCRRCFGHRFGRFTDANLDVDGVIAGIGVSIANDSGFDASVNYKGIFGDGVGAHILSASVKKRF